jgi:opacity protein-like surface antigen
VYECAAYPRTIDAAERPHPEDLSMKYFVRYSAAIVVIAASAVGTARAQTVAATVPDRGYAAFTIGATLGHKSDSSIGGEVGYGLTDALQVFFEAGRMGNVATSDIDARAQKIANTFGASVSAVQRATYYDAGLKYRLSQYGMWRPYVLLGLGAASVKTTVNFNVGGNDVTNRLDQFGVQLGSDLSGTLTKTFLTIGFGSDVTFGKRYLAGLSYRYGRIFSKTSEIDNDRGINTQRVQAGVGIKF